MISRVKQLANSALNHQGFMRYFANTSWMFGEQILRMLSGLLVGIWVARYLGPQQFGIFSYAIAFVSIFGSVAKLGLDGILVRDLVNEPEKRDVYLGTAFWLKLVGAFAMLLIIAFSTIFTSNDHTTNLYIFIIASGIIFQSFEVIDFYFQAKVLSKFVSLCKITQLVLSSILKVYFVLNGADLLWFVIVSLIDQASLAIALYIAYRYQRLSGFYKHFDINTAIKLLKDSWPLILSGLAVGAYMRIDQIMIKEMLGDEKVGLYSVAVRLTEIWYFIPGLITSSFFPAIVSSRSISKELYYSRLQKLYDLMFLLALFFAVPITFFSDWVVTVFYGTDYRSAGVSLAVNIWAGVFVFLGVVNAKYLLVEGRGNFLLYLTIVCCVLNIVLNLFLIPKYGIIGASIATLLAQSFGLISNVFFKSTRIGFYMQINTLFFYRRLKDSFR